MFGKLQLLSSSSTCHQLINSTQQYSFLTPHNPWPLQLQLLGGPHLLASTRSPKISQQTCSKWNKNFLLPFVRELNALGTFPIPFPLPFPLPSPSLAHCVHTSVPSHSLAKWAWQLNKRLLLELMEQIWKAFTFL